jgi:tetratricopeptide (TPR) repeat protein
MNDKNIPGSSEKTAFSSRFTTPAAALMLILLVLVAYSSIFSAGFIWDDDAYVINNPHLRSIAGLYNIWFEPGATPQYYPLVFTIFWAQHHLWGLDPLGYHLVNILLHGANAILLWICLRRLEIPWALLAACIFALHPVHVESVAWITELKNVMSTFFYLLAFLTYWGGFGTHADIKSRGSAVVLWCAALVLFLLALFSKTVSGSLPAAILLLVWWQRGRVVWRDIARLVPFFALALVLGRQTAKLEVTHVLAMGPEWDFSFVERLLIAGRALWFYAGKLFWPNPLIFNYPRWQIDAGAWWQYLCPLSLVLLLFALWYLRNRVGRGALTAVLFFAGTLFPAIGFFNVYPMRFSFVADHFQYLASIGIIVIFSSGLGSLLQKLHAASRYAGVFLPVVIVLILSLLTWRQGAIYANNLTLFSDTIVKNPVSWFSYSNRATYYANEGSDDLAMDDIARSLRIKPDEADALHLRGMISLKRQNFDGAFADFNRSIFIRPWRTDYLKNRCVAYRYAGQLDKALSDADRIVALEPDDFGNYQLRASINLLREDYSSALADLNRALALGPEEADVWANRGLVSYRQGHYAEAIVDYSKALGFNPDSAPTFYNRGLALAADGDSVAARADLKQAKRLGYSLSERDIARILSHPAR